MVRFRRGLILTLLAFTVLPAGATTSPAPPRDIDVGIPPGTPLDWSRDLFRPVITARHGVIPPRAGKKPKEVREGSTIVEERVPEPMLLPFGQTGLYNHFRVTTFDIERHIMLTWRRKGRYDPDVPSGEKPDLVWEYPPLYPTEIYWSGALNSLRAILHPEIVSTRELSAYLLEMGECALVSSRSIMVSSTNTPLNGPTPLQGYRVYGIDVPDKHPPVSGGETPREQAIYRLVVTELTNGFPYALDPAYAKRTLALGREASWALIEATKSKHLFLARNAVTILGELPYPDARKRLREIIADGKDPVMWVRAATALIRARDLEITTEFEKWAKSNDELLRVVAIYGIGIMADPRPLKSLLKLARDTDDPDLLWSLLPAIARICDGSDDVKDTVQLLLRKKLKPARKQAGVGGFIPPEPEPVGTRDNVFREMIALIRAASGESKLRSDLIAKARRKGVTGFFRANQYLVIDVLRRIGKGGRSPLLKAVENREMDLNLRVAALNALRPIPNSMKKGLRKMVDSGREPSVLRSHALLALAELEETDEAREAAMGIVRTYLKRTSVAPPPQSALVATAIQVLAGSEGGLPTQVGVDVITKALKDRAWGFRITRESTRLTKAVIFSQPPLLEIAIVELGRTLDPAAIPVFIRVLRSRAGGGRAQAALALGAFGGPEATQALVHALADAVSGWVRYNAYRGLREVSGLDYYDDYLFSPPVLIKKSIRKYQAWWKSVQK